MKVLSWNVRGAANLELRRHLKDLIKLHNPTTIAILAPKVSGNKATNIIHSFGFSKCIRVDAIGFSGGIWLMWNPSQVSVQYLSGGSQVINAFVQGDSNYPWLLSVVSVSTDQATRDELWQAFMDISPTHSWPWLVVGDFNQITCLEDKEGGSPINLAKLTSYISAMDICKLVDLGFTGSRFTWSDSWDTGRRIMERLDRAHANPEWRVLFPHATVRNLHRRSSDHIPILIDFMGAYKGPKIHKLFRFEAAWVMHSDFGRLMEDEWLSEDSNLSQLIESFKPKIQQWSKMH